MSVVMSLRYFVYLAPFSAVGYFDLATETARRWRWRHTKVFDPNGHYDKASEQGPFFEGPWRTGPQGDPTDKK
jgi:hypothetical protein